MSRAMIGNICRGVFNSVSNVVRKASTEAYLADADFGQLLQKVNAKQQITYCNKESATVIKVFLVPLPSDSASSRKVKLTAEYADHLSDRGPANIKFNCDDSGVIHFIDEEVAAMGVHHHQAAS